MDLLLRERFGKRILVEISYDSTSIPTPQQNTKCGDKSGYNSCSRIRISKILTETSSGFHQSFQANAETLPKIMPRPLHFAYFIILISRNILSFDAK
jgi:hypothetical protein